MEHAILLLLLCIPVAISNPCANQTLGSQPYPGDCGAYIVCWLSMPYLQTCPNNLRYDVNTNSCQPLHLSICCNVTFQATTHQNIPHISSVSTHSPSFTIPTLPPITESSLPSSTTLDVRNTATSIDHNTQNIGKLKTVSSVPLTTFSSKTRLSTLESGQSATTQNSPLTPVEISPTTNMSLPLEPSTKDSTPVTKIISQKYSTTGTINTKFTTNLTPTISHSPITTTSINKSTLTDSPSTSLIGKNLTSTAPTIITKDVPTIVSLSPDSSQTTHSIQTPSGKSKITTVPTYNIKSTLIKKVSSEPSTITRPVTVGTVPTREPSVTMLFTKDQAKIKFPSSTPFTTELITIKPSSSIATIIPTTNEIITSSFELTSVPLITTKPSASSSSLIHTSLNTEFITPTKLSLPPITDTSKFTTNRSVSTQTTQKRPYVSSTMPITTSIIDTSETGTITSESIILSTPEINRPSLLPITNGSISQSTKTYQPTTIIKQKSSIEPGIIPVTESYVTTTISSPIATKATILPHSTPKSILTPITFTTLETIKHTLEPIITTKRDTLTEQFTTSYITPTTISPQFTEPTIKISYETTLSPITMNTKHKISTLEPETKTEQFTTFNPITIVPKTTNISPPRSTQSQLPSFVFTTRKPKTETFIPALTTKPARTEQTTRSQLTNTALTSVTIESSIPNTSHQSSAKPSFPPGIVNTIKPTEEILEPLPTKENMERGKFTTSYTELTTSGPAIAESNTTNTAFYSTIQSSIPSNIVTTEAQHLTSFSPTSASTSLETTNNPFTVPTDSIITSTESIKTLTSPVSQPEPISRPKEITLTTPIQKIPSTSSISFTPSESISTSKLAKNATPTIPAPIPPIIPTSTKNFSTPIQSIFTLTTPTLSTLPTVTAEVPISTPIDLNMTINTSVSKLPTISPEFSTKATQTAVYSTSSTILTKEIISELPSTSSKYRESPSTMTTSYDRNTSIKTTIISPGQPSKFTTAPTIGTTPTFSTAENRTQPATSNTKFIVTESTTYQPYSKPTTVANIPSITDYFSKITKLAKPTLPPISTTVYIPPCHTSPKPTPTITRYSKPLPVCRSTDRFLYPDLANCSSYYKCFYGTVRKLKCKYGYQFNPRALKCMPRIEANCRIITDLRQEQAFLSEFIRSHNLLEEKL